MRKWIILASNCRPLTHKPAGQILEAGVRGSGSLDDKRIAEWLKTNRADTIIGRVRFDGPNNYGDDVNRLKRDLAGCPTNVH